MNYRHFCIGLAGGLAMLAICEGPAAAQNLEQGRETRQAIVRLNDIPDADLRIGVPQGATIRRWPAEYGAAPPVDAPLYIAKQFEAPRAIGCANRNLPDEIDLSRIRRNGFHLLEARATPVDRPEGFGAAASDTGPSSVALVGAGDTPAAIARDAEKIRIRAAVWQRDDGRSASVQCVSAYRIHIVLRGPGQTDPFEG